MRSILCSQCNAHIAFINADAHPPEGIANYISSILTCNACTSERIAFEAAVNWRANDAFLPEFDNPDACRRFWERQNESTHVAQVLREWRAFRKYAMPENELPPINLFAVPPLPEENS